ncbi:MAG: trypsin-like peptidase domain-containing protein [Phycisphaerae bacterium]|nr:trypsin-like peptidase domain-containing protein [Phycisphaerae bacterium]
MKIYLFALAGIAALLLAGSASAADRVVLKSGSEVTGEILKNDDKIVIIDIGTTVLRLARTDVLRVDRSGGATTRPDHASATTQPIEKSGPAWQLYRTAKLEPDTVEKKSDANAEAVVMVTSAGGQGSGFVVNPDGYVVTNYHVIANETRIKVTLFKQTDQGFENRHFKKVKIVALNPFEDLALLKIEDATEPLKYIYLGSMEDLKVGQECFAIGNPLGLTRTVSQGIVSTKNRNFEGRLYIQTTTDINPGNSGGPLFNLKGEVIGVTSMGYIYLGGLNFAIPCDVVKRFIENRDAFAYDEDNPNAGYRYLQPAGRRNPSSPPPGRWPQLEPTNR